MRVRRFVFAWLALSASTILALVAVECVLRLVWTPPSFRSDAPFGSSPIRTSAPLPGVSGRLVKWEYNHPFVHNGQRLRAKKNFTAALPGEFAHRVLFLGDSFTYGLGSADDETFVERVHAALPGVEVINGGSNGYGQREELAFLDTYGAALKPGLTVLVFFWNDLEDNIRRTWPAFAVDEGGRVRRSDLSEARLRKYDPLAKREPATLVKMRRGGLDRIYLKRVLSEGLKGLRYRIVGIRPRSIQTESEKAEAWEVTELHLDLIRRRAEEIGTRLLVVALPDQNRVDPGAYIRGIEPLNYEVEETLSQICARLGVDFHDLTPALRAARESGVGPLYYYTDRHLTPAGNEIVARDLVPLIETRLPGLAEPVRE